MVPAARTAHDGLVDSAHMERETMSNYATGSTHTLSAFPMFEYASAKSGAKRMAAAERMPRELQKACTSSRMRVADAPLRTQHSRG